MKKIVNCFCKKTSSGFGDFLRGSIHLYERLKNYDIDFDIDLGLHPISLFIERNSAEKYTENEIEIIKPENNTDDLFQNNEEMDKRLSEIIDNFKKTGIKFIFSNYHYLFKIKNSKFIMNCLNEEELSQDCKAWFKSKLKFSENITKAAEKEVSSIINKEYEVIHFRLGDRSSFYKIGSEFKNTWVPDLEDCWEECLEISKKQKKKMTIIIMSDSNELKNYIDKKIEKESSLMKVIHKKSGHTQKKPTKSIHEELKVKKENFFFAALDMKILTMASRVHSFSVYFWGSGFVTWICKIFDVPISIQPLVYKERYLD